MPIRFVLTGIFPMVFQNAVAHHAFSANYDINSPGTVQGVVEEVFWANPHVHFYIRVINDAGTDELWDVEWSHLKGMGARGWNRDTLRVGDEIRVTGHLGRDGTRMISIGLSYGGIVRGDGSPLP